jgi:hypothetical protein
MKLSQIRFEKRFENEKQHDFIDSYIGTSEKRNRWWTLAREFSYLIEIRPIRSFFYGRA